MRKIALLAASLFAAFALAACNAGDEHDYLMYKATRGLGDAVGGYEGDVPYNQEYEDRMLEERIDRLRERQEGLDELYGD